MWATNFDPLTATSDEAVQMADRTAAFIDGMGGAQSDLLVVEWSDRDAGRGIRPWWDDTDQLSPRPTRALLWENALSRAANKRLLLWQVPVGNMSLENVCQRYQDNRLAYLFTHPRELFETGVVGIVFGGGDGCSTQVTTDGGFVGAQGLIAYAVPAAPEGLSASSPSGNQVVLRWDSNTDPDLWRYRVSYRMEPSGSPYSLDTGRRNSLTLALPGPGTFRVSVQVLDAMGNTSAASNAVMVTITAGGGWIYLPVFRY
jgi:hypothetical protein